MSDDSTECIHGLGPIAACVLCNGRAKREAAADEEDDHWRIFAAKYDGQCPACDLPIRAGDSIAWKPDTRPLHQDCIE